MEKERKTTLHEFEGEDTALDHYSDAINISTGPYGTSISFGIHQLGDRKPILRSVVRLSPPMAKVLCLLLRKQLRQYEQDTGYIRIPRDMEEQLGLEREL